MILLTRDLRERLIANGRQHGTDHAPVVKFFNPLGESVWLATELDADGDIMFGLADLGYPELGSFSLDELSSIRLPFGMAIERDVLFETDKPISAWAAAAHKAAGIRAAERVLDSARPSACSTQQASAGGNFRRCVMMNGEHLRATLVCMEASLAETRAKPAQAEHALGNRRRRKRSGAARRHATIIGA